MTYKSNVGTMEYNDRNQLIKLSRNNGSTVSYGYDANGNETSRNGQASIKWTSFNKPSDVTKSGHVSSFTYDANRNRATQSVFENNGEERTYYVGGGYELVKDTRGGADLEQYRINLYAGKKLIGVYIKSIKGNTTQIDKLRYFTRDIPVTRPSGRRASHLAQKLLLHFCHKDALGSEYRKKRGCWWFR